MKHSSTNRRLISMIARWVGLPILMCALVVPLIASGQDAEPVLKKTQEKEPTATISVSANLVNLPVVVRDKKNALVQNLTKDDFALSVDGHPQTIRYFDRDNNVPLTLGLLVDTSQSQRSVLDDERNASGAFLDSMLTAPAEAKVKDQAFVIQFARETELLQDLTPSKPKLNAALKELDTTPSGGGSSSNDPSDPNSSGRGRRGGGTTLYDAIYLSSDELMKKQHGRKAVIVLTDGVDNGSKKSLASSIEAAQRSDTVVYAIYFKGQEHNNNSNNGNRGGGFPGGRGGGFPGGGGGGWPGGGGGGRNGGGGGQRPGGNETRVDGKKILERITGETGGRLYEVTKKDTVDSIYKQIGEELRSQYRLGYSPDAANSAEGYHQVELTVPKQKNLYVQTRDGYYTGTQ